MNNLHQSQDPSFLTHTLRSSHASNPRLESIELQKPKSIHSSRLKQITDPIEILSDDEEQHIIKERFRQELLRAKIEEAKLTKSKTNLLKVLYVQLHLKDYSAQNKEKKFNGLVKTYIANNLKTNKREPFDIRNSHFCEQLITKPDDEFIENEYMLYGCDLLSHRAIQKMFQFYAPSIKWIDSSHCKLTFIQKNKGWEAVINNCRDLNQLLKDQASNMKVQNLMNGLQLDKEEMEEQFETQYNEEYAKLDKSKKEFHLLKNYVDLMPYFELGFRRRLMIRNVTVAEQKMSYKLDVEKKAEQPQIFEQKKPECEFKKYLRVKQNLWRDIENDDLVKPMYQAIQRQISKEQQLLMINKRTKPKDHTFYSKPSSNYGSHRQPTNNAGSKFDNMSQHIYGQGVNSNPRNRSRDHSSQYYGAENHGYAGRGREFRRDYNRGSRWESLEKHFDNYIEQRQTLKVVQNPHQYLEPEFVDEKTGTHFYKNPFYKPQNLIENPIYHPNYNRNNSYQPKNNFYPYPFPNQPLQNNHLPSEYEYQGNKQSNHGDYRNNYNQLGGNSQFGGNFKNNKNPFYQNQTDSEKGTISRRSSIAEDQFNNYIAERQAVKNRSEISQKDSRKGSSHNEIQNTENVFEGDVDFSIISEEKSKGSTQRIEYMNEEKNLENILNEISDLENEHEDEESEGLEFMLVEQRQYAAKKEANHRVNKDSGKVNANIPGYIEEQIREEDLGKWINLNKNFSGNSEMKGSVLGQQQSYGGQNQGSIMILNDTGIIQQVKKKIPRKKSRSNSKSLNKRAGESLDKKGAN